MTSRKRTSLSLQEKLNILRVVKENPTRKKVCIAKELGLTPCNLNSIVAKRIEIEENARTFDVKCKQARSSEHVQLDTASTSVSVCAQMTQQKQYKMVRSQTATN
ncbi:hypothetical protein HPB51_023385 [Rhipicephalus microplus]|uniref:HTH psq-type domain-containing protein n=1 Tax=Rhipicephalus microplus TaxID=6941 RepID=A0A9J6DJF0_RHIMP|nr:hypothetical protein HPB51_023385 [Rhipicephalus microplus]